MARHASRAPADASGKPGRVFVTIPFHAREQIGFFVFHCHILEHEDGGMMAVVQVFDPAHPRAAADAATMPMPMPMPVTMAQHPLPH